MRTLIRQDRDLRIDFFRGLALWSMFILHVDTSWLRVIIIRQYTFCDSAELFVFMSGIAAAIVYRRILIKDGLVRFWIAVLRRVMTIYRTHVITFMIFVAGTTALSAWLRMPTISPVFELKPLSSFPYRSILDFVLLRYQPYFFDILPLYITLLCMLCVVLPLTRWPRLVLSCSLLLYAATRVFHLSMPGSSVYFNPLAWQAIFFTGVVSGRILTGKNYWRGWDILAASFALFSLFETHARQLVNHVPAALLIHFEVDKPNLHPFRFLALISLAWLVWRYLPASAIWLRSRVAAPLVLMGQHSLPVFSASILVAALNQVLAAVNAGRLSQSLLQSLGCLMLVAVAAVAALNNRDKKPRSRAIKAPERELAGAVA